MANPEHLTTIKEGIDKWNDWRRRTGIPGSWSITRLTSGHSIAEQLGGLFSSASFLKQAEINGTDLSGADFRNADLRGADLEGTNLRRARLSNADLTGADLNEADLRGASLQRAHLSRANLCGADLTGAVLRGANLWQADLSGAILSGGNFRDAYMRDAKLTKANLQRANLTNANLTSVDLAYAKLEQANLADASLAGTYLEGTDLTGANFTGVRLSAAIFADVDLSAVIGIENVMHFGPSTMGVDTLYRSSGNIPDIFLRGAGLQESLITYAKSLIRSPVDFYSCFISYSHADESFAYRLHDTLHGRGIRCWLDEKQLLPGDALYEHIDRGIRQSDKFLLCCSKHSLKPSSWVDKEILTALEKEDELTRQRGQKVHALIPLNLDDYIFTDGWKSGYRAQIRSRLAADFTGWERDNSKFEEQVKNIIRALRADEASRDRLPQPKL